MELQIAHIISKFIHFRFHKQVISLLSKSNHIYLILRKCSEGFFNFSNSLIDHPLVALARKTAHGSRRHTPVKQPPTSLNDLDGFKLQHNGIYTN